MKKLLFTFVVSLSLISLSACSLAPGIPGLKIDSSRYAKAQKEGVDYKLIVINAHAIKNQQPFNYARYIKDNKKRYQASLRNKTQLRSRNPRIAAINYAPSARSASVTSNIKMSGKRVAGFSNIATNLDNNNYKYRIGKNDILGITVWDNPELTLSGEKGSSVGHKIDNKGNLYFPYAGNIRALGKTTIELRSILKKKLAKFITNPQVSVRVVSFRSKKVYVSGAVLKPSSVGIGDIALTVRDALSRSGGVTPTLFTGYASLARGGKKVLIDLNRMLRHNDNSQNYLLKNGDRLHIIEKDEEGEWRKNLNREIQKERILNPIRLKFELQKEHAKFRLKDQLEQEKRIEIKAEQAKFFVMGEVHKPGTQKYQVEDDMTLAEAINNAGSFKEETVNPKGIFVVRKESAKDTIPTVYQLPLASVHSMLLAEQFKIRPRDIIYVTATPSIRWNRVLSQLIPSLTLVNTVSNLSR